MVVMVTSGDARSLYWSVKLVVIVTYYLSFDTYLIPWIYMVEVYDATGCKVPSKQLLDIYRNAL